MKNLMTAFFCMAMLALAGCAENDGPAERLGESIDNATADVRDAAEDVGNELEDACEEIKEGAGAEDKNC